MITGFNTSADNTSSATLSDDELLRYSRQVLLEGWDMDAQLRLKNSRVVIIGAGGLGCPVSEVLARAGVGHIHLIDDDDIEISNLQRQTLFKITDVGQPKAQIAKRELQDINEFIEVSCDVVRITENNIKDYLKPHLIIDEHHTSKVSNILLLDCTDNFTIRELLNNFSVQYKTPLLSASAIAMSGQLALFEPKRDTGCYYCVFGGTNAVNSNNTQNNPQANCVNSGVLASTTAIMGSLQANAALQYLGLAHNPMLSQLLLWDGKSMQQRRIRYRKDIHCPICGIPKT